jgi:3-oxoacyl-[acyl-carrier protein] reductase
MEKRLLNRKICLITGTSQGIGKRIAELFVEEGGTVYANARKEGCLEEWAKKVNSAGKGTVIPLYFDITIVEQVRKSILKLKKDEGRVDVLVNNAGMVSNDILGMISLDKARKMFEVNVFGLLELSQLIATRFMMGQREGSIINIASIVGIEGSRGQTAYSASKGAVIALTKSMSKELAPYNVRVNAIAPGMIQSERLRVNVKGEYKDKADAIGMGRLGEACEVAGGCLYFASKLSNYTTGQVLAINGGYDTLSRSLFDIRYEE